MTKRILFLSFFYPPDLSAGSFRSAALVEALSLQGGERLLLDVVTTQPNRYQSFLRDADSHEELGGLTIHRLALPNTKEGLLGQVWSFLHFALGAYRLARGKKYDVVVATSSRLMTALLGALLAAGKGTKLYLDIRDIFVETLAGVFSLRLFRPVVWAFGTLERWAVRRATAVNLVSPGFLPYFQSRYPGGRFSFFSNGVDTEFTDPVVCGEMARPEDVPLRVLYAGNIGDGQGLHLIVPVLAERLKGRITFQIIGDGRQAGALRNAVNLLQLDNVELLMPMSRQEIKALYEQADVLFLHLNDLKAFRRVLPSKLFEYAATGKPIWAGVAGYAAEFIAAELSNVSVFKPCDVEAALESFEQLELGLTDRAAFVQRYARERIMDEMARDILQLLEPA